MRATLFLTAELATGTPLSTQLACTAPPTDLHPNASVQLGPRPFYLVQGMDEVKLKDRLTQCEKGPFYRTDFSIGHRGSAMQFPEHSDVAYRAGARMGAGIGEVVPSQYAIDIKSAGLDIITWTFERPDLRQGASAAGWYYLFDPQGKAIKKDSDMYVALDVLARKISILGIFSDWPATVTYYANSNCMGLK